MGKIAEFYRKYTVLCVMVPSIVGLHWAWLKLQDNEKLVSKQEKQGLPYGRMYHMAKSLLGIEADATGNRNKSE